MNGWDKLLQGLQRATPKEQPAVKPQEPKKAPAAKGRKATTQHQQ